MMPVRTVEDRLREEYFDLLPEIRRVLEHLGAEIRYRLLPISRKLDKFERLDVSSRLKECESAVEALRRRQQGAIFYPNPATPYTLGVAWERSDDRGSYISVAFEEPSLAPGRYTLVKTGVEKGYTLTFRKNMPPKDGKK